MTLNSETEEQLVNELRDSFLQISNSTVGSQGEKRWLDNNQRLIDLVRSEDPRNFLQWDVIKRTMEVGNADFISEELDFLRSREDWQRWQQAITEVRVGNPTMSEIYPASSGNLIHHAYHVAKFETTTSRLVNEMDCIFEFGGGYGGMCRLVHNLGFKGRYIMFDFPAFSALQKYFVKSIGLTTSSIESFRDSTTGLVCISDIAELEMLLSEYVSPGSNMLLATWSLSEAPLAFRTRVLNLLSGFTNILLAYQGQFEGIDNIGFFEGLVNDRSDLCWNNFMIEHLPNDFYKNNFYMMGQG